VAFALSTGLRHGEMRGLLRDCLDFERRTITVRRIWDYRNGEGIVERTKTGDPRTINFPPILCEILADKRRLNHDEQIFPFLHSRYLFDHLYPLMDEAGVPRIRIHDFRHTFATHLLMQGKT